MKLGSDPSYVCAVLMEGRYDGFDCILPMGRIKSLGIGHWLVFTHILFQATPCLDMLVPLRHSLLLTSLLMGGGWCAWLSLCCHNGRWKMEFRLCCCACTWHD